MTPVDSRTLEVLAPNLKRRHSGVTSTIMRLVPIQARQIAIATVGPKLPPDVPQVPLVALLTLPLKGPHGTRVWHARRNVEMLAGLALKHLLGKRLRLVFTSASQREHTGYTKWLVRQMDAVVATSARSASYLERPATVIRHGIDLTDFRPAGDVAAVRRQLSLPTSSRLVGCYGRIRRQKGTDRFVEALIRHLPALPGWEGVVMGGITAEHRPFLENLRAQVAAAGLSERIHIRPEVAPWQMAAHYQALDLFVAPQRHEGFGLTPLEAMACGVPVVATDAGAFDELVVPETTGLVVPRADDAALEAAIGRALADDAARGRWAAAAPTHVAENFRIEDEAAALVALYREIMT